MIQEKKKKGIFDLTELQFYTEAETTSNVYKRGSNRLGSTSVKDI